MRLSHCFLFVFYSHLYDRLYIRFLNRLGLPVGGHPRRTTSLVHKLMACSTSTHTTRGLPYRFAHHRPPRQMVMCVEHRQSQRRIGTRLLVHRRTTIVCEHTRYRLIDILVSLTEIAFAAPTTALDVDRLNFPSVAFGIILATYAINAALTSSLISHPRWSSGAGSIPGSPV